jgi:hypothetical protein
MNDTLELMDLTDVYLPVTAQYTFFSAAHESFSKMDHILGHKASLNEYKKIEISSYMSDHNATKLEFDIKEPAENTQTAED